MKENVYFENYRWEAECSHTLDLPTFSLSSHDDVIEDWCNELFNDSCSGRIAPSNPCLLQMTRPLLSTGSKVHAACLRPWWQPNTGNETALGCQVFNPTSLLSPVFVIHVAVLLLWLVSLSLFHPLQVTFYFLQNFFRLVHLCSILNFSYFSKYLKTSFIGNKGEVNKELSPFLSPALQTSVSPAGVFIHLVWIKATLLFLCVSVSFRSELILWYTSYKWYTCESLRGLNYMSTWLPYFFPCFFI